MKNRRCGDFGSGRWILFLGTKTTFVRHRCKREYSAALVLHVYLLSICVAMCASTVVQAHSTSSASGNMGFLNLFSWPIRMRQGKSVCVRLPAMHQRRVKVMSGVKKNNGRLRKVGVLSKSVSTYPGHS